MSEAAGLVVLEKVVEKLLDTIWRQFSYLFCFNRNIKNLTDGAQDLQNKRDDVKRLADAANRNTEIIGADVVAWLINVEEVESKAQQVDEDRKKVKNGCLGGWGPKGLKNRYWLSRKAVKQNVVVLKLQEEGKAYTQLSYPALPSGMVAPKSAVGHEVYESRISMMKEILETLKNDKITAIGICGLGGIGKTRMVKEISKSALEENLIDEVAMVVVSQNLELSKIQGDLAKMLGLDLDEKDNTDARAEKLHKRLMQDNRSLVILDDVWKQLDLGEVGIPVQGEGRCKLLLTTRNEHVCRTMKTQKIFAVQLLSEREAWDLFKDKAGGCVESTDIRPVAENVLDECGRLPLAIAIVGSALNGREKYAWDDALQQLKSSTITNIEGMNEDVYSSLELSFNYLDRSQRYTLKKETNEIQRLFLLCCLFQEDYDIPIECLVRHAIGLRLFEDSLDLAATRNRVQSLADQLKCCYLLLDSDRYLHVKVHDVVRDFGLAFASKGEHVYMVRHYTGLKEWPQNSQASTAISISEEGLDLPIHLDYPRLTLLQLFAKGSLEISRDYFGRMEELKVVGFRRKFIYSVDMLVEAPSNAIQFFTNVQTLSLEYCRFGGHIGFIGSLHKLEILSFYASEMNVLPIEIRQLSNLKLLDLRCTRLDLIPSGVLSCLSKLEALYMGNYFHGHGFEEQDGAKITELNMLARMRTLQICTFWPYLLEELQDSCLKELLRFDFTVSTDRDEFQGDSGYEFSNALVLKGTSFYAPVKTKIMALMSRVEILELRNVESLEALVTELDESPLNLKELYISDCDNLRELCKGRLPARSFEKLIAVTLRDLPQMGSLWKGPIQPPCLSNLVYIYLRDCDAIKSLFPQSVVKCLVQLQDLHLHGCDMLEEIVSKEEAECEKDAKIIGFPKLNTLSLRSLRSLRSFIPISDILGSEINNHDGIIPPLLKQVILPSLEMLTFRSFYVGNLVGGLIEAGCLYKLRVLDLVCCDGILHVAASDTVGLLQNLEKLEVILCPVETVFDFEGREHAEAMLSRLESIRLDRLPSLKHVWKMVPKRIQGFQNLRDLDVCECNSLRYLFSPSIAKLLVNIQSIKLTRCEKIKVVIQMDEEQEEGYHSSSEIQKMDSIVFHQLRFLKLCDLPRFTMFCRENLDIEFPYLDDVQITTFHPGTSRSLLSTSKNLRVKMLPQLT